MKRRRILKTQVKTCNNRIWSNSVLSIANSDFFCFQLKSFVAPKSQKHHVCVEKKNDSFFERIFDMNTFSIMTVLFDVLLSSFPRFACDNLLVKICSRQFARQIVFCSFHFISFSFSSILVFVKTGRNMRNSFHEKKFHLSAKEAQHQAISQWT